MESNRRKGLGIVHSVEVGDEVGTSHRRLSE